MVILTIKVYPNNYICFYVYKKLNRNKFFSDYIIYKNIYNSIISLLDNTSAILFQELETIILSKICCPLIFRLLHKNARDLRIFSNTANINSKKSDRI